MDPPTRPCCSANVLIHDATEAALPLFDATMREYAYQRNQERCPWVRTLTRVDPSRRPRRGPARSDLADPCGGTRRRIPRSRRSGLHPDRDRAASRSGAGRCPGGCRSPGEARKNSARGAGPGLPVARSSARKPSSSRGFQPGPSSSSSLSPHSMGSTSVCPTSSADGFCSGRSTATSWRALVASLTARCKCRAGRTSGPCRSRTGWTCWPRG